MIHSIVSMLHLTRNNWQISKTPPNYLLNKNNLILALCEKVGEMLD